MASHDYRHSICLLVLLLSACEVEAPYLVDTQSESGLLETTQPDSAEANLETGDTSAGPIYIVESSADGDELVSVSDEELKALIEAYNERVAQEYEPMFDGQLSVSYASGGSKILIDPNNDTRQLVADPESYPENKHVFIYMQRPHMGVDRRDGGYICSGTIVDEDHIVTAAHCIYNRDAGHYAFANDVVNMAPDAPLTTSYGVDFGMGYACLGGPVTTIQEFQDNCEFIERRWAPLTWMANIVDKREADFAVLRTQRANHAGGLGQGRWMAMSALDTEPEFQGKNVSMRQYPALVLGASNVSSSTDLVYDPTISTVQLQSEYWEFHHADQYIDSGATTWHTTREELAYNVDSSGGSSGSGVFYYSDNGAEFTGQASLPFRDPQWRSDRLARLF